MNGYNAGYDSCSGESSGSGSSSGGDGEDDTAGELCGLLDNIGVLLVIALALGFPGLTKAASLICGVTGNT